MQKNWLKTVELAGKISGSPTQAGQKLTFLDRLLLLMVTNEKS